MPGSSAAYPESLSMVEIKSGPTARHAAPAVTTALAPGAPVRRPRRERPGRECAHHRQQPGARLERVVVEHLLHELRQEEQGGEEGRGHEQNRDADVAEV